MNNSSLILILLTAIFGNLPFAVNMSRTELNKTAPQPAAVEVSMAPASLPTQLPEPTVVPTAEPVSERIVIREPASYLPTEQIPSELYAAGAMNKFFDYDHGKTLAVDGHWLLYASDADGILPIPEGWTTQEEEGVTFLTYVIPQETRPAGPSIIIRIDIMQLEEADTVSYLMNVIADEQSVKPNMEIKAQTVIDEQKGYFLFRSGEEGNKRSTLYYLAAVPGTPGSYYRWIAQVKETDWDLCSPVITTMLAHWMTSDYQELGASLPQNLGK